MQAAASRLSAKANATTKASSFQVRLLFDNQVLI
jgi:hypothetical protein